MFVSYTHGPPGCSVGVSCDTPQDSHPKHDGRSSFSSSCGAGLGKNCANEDAQV